MALTKRTCDSRKVSEMIQSERITVVVGTQNGCPHCPPWVERLKKNMPRDVALVEIPSNNGKPSCTSLHRDLKIKYTPDTSVYCNGRRIRGKCDNYSDLRKAIERARGKR